MDHSVDQSIDQSMHQSYDPANNYTTIIQTPNGSTTTTNHAINQSPTNLLPTNHINNHTTNSAKPSTNPSTNRATNQPTTPKPLKPGYRRFLGVDHPPGAIYTVALLICVNLVNYIDRYIPSAVKTQIKEHFELSDFETSLPLTIFVLVYMAACPVFGTLADRGIDRRQLMCFGVCLWSIFTALAALCDTYGLFVFVRAMVGIGEASYSMIAPAIISDFYDPTVRGKVLGWYYAAIPIGAALGFALGGSIGSSLGWKWAFVVIGAPGLLLGLALLTIKDPPRGASDKKPKTNQASNPSATVDRPTSPLLDDSESLLSDQPTDQAINQPAETQWYVLKQLMKNPTFVIATFGQTLSTFGAGGAADWFPVYMMREFNFSEDEAGFLVGGCTVIGGLFGTIFGSYLADWFKWRIRNSYLAVSGWSSLISAALIFILLVSGSIPAGVVLVLVAFSQIGLWMNIGPITAVVANVTDSRHRTRAFAVSTFFQHAFGDAASPSIIGAMSDALGLRVAAVIIPISWVCCGMIWVVGSRAVPDHQRIHHNKQKGGNDDDDNCESVYEDMEGIYEDPHNQHIYEDDQKQSSIKSSNSQVFDKHERALLSN